MNLSRPLSNQERGKYARRALLVSGIVISALAAYAIAATALWYPGGWPLAVFLGVFGAAVIFLGQTQFWVPTRFR